MNNKSENKNENISNIDKLLKSIHEEYESQLSRLKNSDYNSLLERVVSAEKDLQNLSSQMNDLKGNIENNTEVCNRLSISYQELTGSINQLKLIIDEFKEYHKEEKENKLNLLFQLIIPIILARNFLFLRFIF